MASPASVVPLDAAGLARHRDELVALLADAIEDGASVGYLERTDRAMLEAFWRGIEGDVGRGERHVLAMPVDGRIVGSAQLAPSAKPNQPHRADVQKLLVHREWRRRGIGAALMSRLEALALEQGRWLLTLDTRTGSDADRLYHAWGWQTLGRVPLYAKDPDGTLADCTFYWKSLR